MHLYTGKRATLLLDEGLKHTIVTVIQPKPITDAALFRVVGGAFARTGSGHDALTGTGNDGILFSGGGQDTVSAGAGNDRAFGGEGRDTLNLDNVTLQRLQASLKLDGNANLQMHVASSPQRSVLTFTDAAGNFAGTVTIGAETLNFSEVKQIRLV